MPRSREQDPNSLSSAYPLCCIVVPTVYYSALILSAFLGKVIRRYLLGPAVDWSTIHSTHSFLPNFTLFTFSYRSHSNREKPCRHGLEHLFCTAHKTQKKLPITKTLEPRPPPFFFLRAFHFFALVPYIPIEPKIGRADMSSLVHSRERVEATAFSVSSFEAHLIP